MVTNNEKKNDSPIQIKKTSLLVKYLDVIKKEEMFGNNHTAIAKSLVWRGIEELISKGRIDRIKQENE